MFVNISRAEADNEIARIEHVADIAVHKLQTRLIGHAAMALRDDFIRNDATANSRNGRFIRTVNIRHDNALGVMKALPNCLTQRFGARITMRLKHRQHALSAD